MKRDQDASSAAGPAHFRSTRWSVIVSAQRGQTPEAQHALEVLAQSYWYPLYAYLRRQNYNSHEACDLTQSFFALLLEREDLKSITPERGRFRSYLMTSLQHFLINQAKRDKALKRGGDQVIVSLDETDAEARYRHEPSHKITPERLFDKAWAMAVLQRVSQVLEEEYQAKGHAKVFAALRGHLIAADDATPYAVLAQELRQTEGSLKVAVHRMRKRFGALLRAEIAETVCDPADIDAEITQLMQSLNR